MPSCMYKTGLQGLPLGAEGGPLLLDLAILPLPPSCWQPRFGCATRLTPELLPGECPAYSAPPAPPCHLGRELPPSEENIISFPACFQMFIIFLFFSLHKGFLKGTSNFGKPAVTQKNLLVLSPMQVKQPKKHDSYNKLIPYASSPIPCVFIINLKHSLFTAGTSFCCAFLPRLKEQDAAVSLSHLVGDELRCLLPYPLLLRSCPSCSCRATLQLPTHPTHPCCPDIALICRHLGAGRGDLKGEKQW